MPANKTMVYTPEITALIVTKAGTLDVSDDIISGRLTRRIDAASDFSLKLNNRAPFGAKQGKYTGKIGRMDRIVIFMKRINWVQVFSGLVTVVPVADLYPSTCTITGVCTIKRLQSFYWNPYTVASRALMSQSNTLASAPNQLDSGIGTMLTNILVKAGNWKEKDVHIQNLPPAWLEFAKQVQFQNKTPAEQQEAYLKVVSEMLGVNINGTSAGAGAEFGVNLPAGAGGSVAPGGAGVVFTYPQLIAQAYAVGIRGNSLPIAAAIAMAESSGRTDAKGGPNSNGSYDYGLWQINDIHKGNSYVPNGDMTKMFDPGANARAMAAISKQGSKWTDWSTFNNGAYRKFMTQAQQAAAQFDPATVPASANGAAAPSPTNTTTGNSVLDAANSAAQSSPGGTSVGTVKGMIDAGLAMRGTPYSWGGGGKDGPSFGIDQGANTKGFDCSGFTQYMVWKGTGGKIDIGGATGTQWPTKLNGHGVSVDRTQVQPGDLLFWIRASGNHTAMYIGNDQMIEAPTTGDVVKVSAVRWGNGFSGILRIKGVTNTGEIIDLGPDAGTAGGGSTAGGTTGVSSAEPLAEALFRVQFLGSEGAALNNLWDDKSFIRSEPLFQTVKAVSAAGMRSFMSAPNGDFVSFYPDPFGFQGKKPAMEIEDIELVNFSMSQNETELATHVFTSFNSSLFGSNVIEDTAWNSVNMSFVGLEDKAVMKGLLNISDNSPELSPETFYSKFGVRPMAAKNTIVRDGTLNYFQTVYTFLQKWSDQFNTRIEMTFMPELYPGMRVKIKSKGLTVYVKEVSHEFSYESGFTTTAIVNSPTTDAGEIPGLVMTNA